MKKTILILVLIFLNNCFLLAQGEANDYFTDYFRAPVEGEVRLSGTFGELRSNHFHSGIDIKGYRGRKIVAAAEGYVYRIQVRAGGYGNALYLKHPNGYFTVYAHLTSFSKEITDYVKKWQAENERFEMDINPDSTLFVFEKGAQVGTMGNSGYSFGPHLHFEIRRAFPERPMNPLLFGIKVQDRRAPLMNQFRVYGLDDKTLSTYSRTFNLRGKGVNRYALDRDTVMVNADRVGLAIKTYDLMDAVRNWNGVYQIEMLVDGEKQYHFEADEFAFEEWKYLNAHVDYADVKENKSYFNRCYLMPGNQFSGYEKIEGNGIITPNTRKAQRVEIITSDIAGNKSRLGFWIKKSKNAVTERKNTFNYYLPHQQENQINNYYLYLKFPEGAFYEDLEMNYHFEQEKGPNIFSTTHSIHDPLTPVHTPFTISIRPNLIPENLQEKAIIARCTDDNSIINCGGKWENGLLTSRVSSFGDYVVMIDTVPPQIRAEDFQYNLSGRKTINFKAKDDIGGGGLDYQASIDGQWVLLTYDLKYDRFSYRFDDQIAKGEHVFKMEIKDNRGNVAIFEKPFIR